MNLTRNASVILLACLVSITLFPRVDDAHGQPRRADPDTSHAGSAALDTLGAKMSRSKLTRWLAQHIFLGVSASDASQLVESAVVPGESYFLPYGGRAIRGIRIVQLPVFSAESGSTSGILDLGNRIHVDTRRKIIEGYLLVNPGEPLDPWACADTERILRNASFIQDATIVVVPVQENPDSVDLLVVTQDVWSIGVAGSIRSEDSYKVKLFERNFLGLGQTLEGEFDVDRARSQDVDFKGLYRIENIRGTFINGEMRYVDSHRENRTQLAFSRPLQTVEIDYGGALALARVEEKNSSADVTRSYDVSDTWIGRAWSVRAEPRYGKARTRLTVSARATAKSYVKREPVTEESSRSLHDATLLLWGLWLGRADFQKTFMMKSYGPTEDLGVGYLVGLTTGFEEGEFNDRWYSGLSISGGASERVFGYYSWAAEAGGFFRSDELQDGAVRVSATALTRLSRPGPFRFRHLFDVEYEVGFKRQSDEKLELKVPGIETSYGDLQRVSLGYEGVAFTPWRPLGFRFAVFGALALGTVGPEADSFLSGKYYSNIGLGFRFHNDRLVFGAYEVRLSFFPSLPPDASSTVFDFTNVQQFQAGSFTAGPPATVSYN